MRCTYQSYHYGRFRAAAGPLPCRCASTMFLSENSEVLSHGRMIGRIACAKTVQHTECNSRFHVMAATCKLQGKASNQSVHRSVPPSYKPQRANKVSTGAYHQAAKASKHSVHMSVPPSYKLKRGMKVSTRAYHQLCIVEPERMDRQAVIVAAELPLHIGFCLDLDNAHQQLAPLTSAPNCQRLHH